MKAKFEEKIISYGLDILIVLKTIAVPVCLLKNVYVEKNVKRVTLILNNLIIK